MHTFSHAHTHIHAHKYVHTALSSRSVTCDEIDSVFGSSVVPTNGSQNTSSAVEASSSDLNSKARRNILSLSNLKSKTHFEDGETIHGRRERTLSVSAVSSGGDCLSHSSIENHDIVVSQLPLDLEHCI